MKRKIIIICALAAAAVLFFAFDLDSYLSFKTLKQRHLELLAFYERRPAVMIGAFMALHVVALALSLPGAVLTMALAGGALFGPGWGILIVLTSLTIGDSLGFLLARYVFRDAVQKRFGRYLAAFANGVDRDGIFFLLGLRLMAIVPYFVVNLTMGLTRMPLRHFAPVSFIGLAPATALYVSAGTELSRIERPSDIYSPVLILSFVLLGLLPIVARLLFKRRGARIA